MREVFRSRGGALFGVSALVALLVSMLGPAVARAAGPTINVIYTNNSLQVKLSDGTVVTSGAVIPAGSYTIQVFDSGDYPSPKFTMTGPGVSVSSELNSSGMGGEFGTFGPFTLQTNSGYAVSDANMGAGSVVAFTTSATTGGLSSSESPGSSSSGSGSSGSKTPTTLGTFKLAVGATGRPTLTFGGKAVKTLKAGKYSVSVGDSSKEGRRHRWPWHRPSDNTQRRCRGGDELLHAHP